MPYSLIAAIGWDIPTWSRALRYWDSVIAKERLCVQYGLEIGARDGGLSYYFATEHAARVCCSDLGFPSSGARDLHQAHGLEDQISYHDVDALHIPFPDASFDFVVFKSVLGGIGLRGNVDRIVQAIAEMHRVLKPGGVLFFAENMKASWLHQVARRRFIRWGHKWYYLMPHELETYLAAFAHKEIHSAGFFAAFFSKQDRMKQFAAYLDGCCLGLIPSSWRYVGFGYALKSRVHS